ncbi:MAG: hypothetical protein BZ138_06175, partial [Methanosphaera sp. rholeuAM270]
MRGLTRRLVHQDAGEPVELVGREPLVGDDVGDDGGAPCQVGLGPANCCGRVDLGIRDRLGLVVDV